MNMKQFNYVTILAQEKSFSRTAEKLNISQPSLSQYIRKIEKELGEELFVRNGSSVKLTDAGRIYIDIGQKILDLEKEMYSRLSDLRENKTGRIVIGAAPFRSVCIMPKVIKEFHKTYPGISVVLYEKVSDELKLCAEQGEYDLCVSTLPIKESLFDYEHMLDEEIVVAVPKEHPSNVVFKASSEKMADRVCPVIDIKLLKNEGFITLGENQRVQKIFNETCGKYGVEIEKCVECVSLESAHSMVNAGIGMTAIPYSFVKYGNDTGDADYYSVKQIESYSDTVVFWEKKTHLSKPMKEMIRILKYY